MNTKELIRGVFSPVLTPFDEQLKPDADMLAIHCGWLVENNAGLAIFGTNPEASSMSRPTPSLVPSMKGL